MSGGNLIFPKGKQNMLNGKIDLDKATAADIIYPICVAMVNTTYEYSAGYEFYHTSVSASQVGDGGTATGTLSSKTIALGVFDAGSVTFSSVASGETVQGIVVFQSGNAGVADYLIAQFDTGSEGAIDITTNGGDVTVNWNGSGLFSL